MAKADSATKELQRRLARLARLDGALVRTADGPVLLPRIQVRDPFALVAACEAAGPPPTAPTPAPTLAVLRAALHLDGEPELLTPLRLARARRDLRALATQPWLTLVRAAPRHFRGLGPLDERWLAAREARVDELARALHPAAPDPLDDDAETGGFSGVLALVADLHGAHARDGLRAWLARSTALGPRRRRDARARVDGLARRLTDPRAPRRESPALAAMLDAAAAELGRLGRLPGRAAARRIDPLLRRVLAWPAAPAHTPAEAPISPDDGPAPAPAAPRPPRSPALPDRGHAPTRPAVPPADPGAPMLRGSPPDLLAARVRARGAELIQALTSTRSPVQQAALRRVLGAYALAFPQPPDTPPPPPLGPDELAAAEQRLREAFAAESSPNSAPAVPPDLPLGRALWLLRLPLDAERRATLATWVAAGLDPALVERVAELRQLGQLAALEGDAGLAAAYARWLIDLVPHYHRLGVTLELRPEHFARLHATHRGGLALLAHCLIVHHGPDERATDARLARLRATLGLFTARPRRAEALLHELSRAPAGLGRQRLPAFATWLGEPPLLDHYCHLCALADEPVALSAQLRRDFERHDRLTRQRDFLAALPTPNPAQRARLAACTTELAAPELADRGWTLRRLADRCEALQGRAFARHLDLLLLEVLGEALGVAPPALTPAWRDALRFFLGGAARNRALLGDLLRFAAAHPGRPFAPTLAKNQAWLARAGAHMRIQAWLAPRRRTLEIDGQRHELSLEDDPLEVLRMGVPFDTCLALETGFNADSTVLNAVDANKRVLYLRDARGSVVARKLIAVASDWTLIGYRLYLARDAGSRPAVAAAVFELCRALADECGLPLGRDGAPETIHPGFWYDDGTEPWELADHGALAPLAPYFAGLGVAAPDALPPWALCLARAWQAHAAGDVEAALALLPDLHGAAHSALAGLIAARLGPRTVAARARREPTLARVQLWLRAREGPVALLRALTRVVDPAAQAREVGDALAHAPPSPAIARALLAAVQHTRARVRRFDDHGLEHRSFQIGPHLACMPVAEALASCAALESLWAWILAASPGCADCRDWGERLLFTALGASFARRPDPTAVILALRGRHGPLARRAALEIAARFSLTARPAPLPPGAGDTWFDRLDQRPLPAPQALRALRDLQRACPALADEPALFAALVRQLGPAGPHTDLPTPRAAPFALLGELLLHLPDPAALLAPWLDPAVDPAAWKPDRWELHVHRRCLTPWRRRLLRLAVADPGAEAPRRWLTRLGDLDALTRLARRDQLARARDIAWQLGLAAGPDVREDRSVDLAPRAGLRAREPADIDLSLLRAAHRALRAEPGDPAARELCLAAELEPEVWHGLLARALPDAGPPAAATLPLLQDLLRRAPLRGLPVDRIARLAAVPALHPALLDYLEPELRGFRVTVHALHSQLAALPSDDPAARDAFLEQWLLRAGDEAAAIDTPMGAFDEERFLACLELWTAHSRPATLLEIYTQLDDHQCARLLQRLRALPPERDEDLRELHELARARFTAYEDEDRNEQVTHAWLLATLAARLAPEPPAP